MMNEQGIEPASRVSWWYVLGCNLESRWWQVSHWLATQVVGLRFCHSCSGYFRAPSMMQPDKCEACYARDYGVPVPSNKGQ